MKNLEEYVSKYKIDAIENLLEIPDKDRRVVPFKLHDIQRDMLETRTGADIYVKPRQIGASELFIADALLDALFIPGTNVIIIAFAEETTKRLLAKSDFFYDSINRKNVTGIPSRHHDSEFKKTFRFYNNPDNPKAGQYGPKSTLYIASARSFIIARGDTYHNVLADEFAFWPEPERIYELLGGRTKSSRLEILSTPNGEDNAFHEMYQIAREREKFGDNVYNAHFYPWYIHSEYQLEPTSKFALPRDQVSPLIDVTSDELELMDARGVSEDQIRWRRFKIAEMEQMRRSGDTKLLFSQEFPEDDISCFLAYGDMAYPNDILVEKAKMIRPPIDHYGNADIWYPPEPGRFYLVAVDPGVGRRSMTAITVWTFDSDEDGNETPKHCATIHGLYDPERTKELAWEIGLWYNTALLCPERNIETVARLLNDYPNRYLFRDPFTGKQSLLFGWYTNSRTKPLMINELRMMLKSSIIHDGRILHEIRNMRVHPDREYVVTTSGLDDLHDSACIAMMCRPNYRQRRGYAFSYGRKK